ncbi:hypothetical protein BD779DRAFT_1480816 [Infundibulicybe gibba]|nr:hypothetical protein BD779DRAFT_1480816 [Infundibulicybe gibba]
MTSRRSGLTPEAGHRAGGVARAPAQAAPTPSSASQPYPTDPAQREASKERSRTRTRTPTPVPEDEDDIGRAVRLQRLQTVSAPPDNRRPSPIAPEAGESAPGPSAEKAADENSDSSDEDAEMPPVDTVYLSLHNTDRSSDVVDAMTDALADIAAFLRDNSYITNDGDGITDSEKENLVAKAKDLIKSIHTHVAPMVVDGDEDETITSPAAAAALMAGARESAVTATAADRSPATPAAPAPREDSVPPRLLARIGPPPGSTEPTSSDPKRKRSRKRKRKERDPDAPRPPPMSYAQATAQEAARSRARSVQTPPGEPHPPRPVAPALAPAPQSPTDPSMIFDCRSPVFPARSSEVSTNPFTR